ncbi:MAG TPA: hypothetical protein VI750_10775 [Pyrinomonadaceae bacterium]|jgi:hypothetical protein|nr:hypothetical protein [Pyrinomonadaceae bacterium]
MAEATQIVYTFKELAEILVKQQDIHEGYWGIYVKFGIKAANAGETDADLRPTALVPILELGLQKFDALNNLSVDASVVNAATVRSRPGGKRATTKVARKR